MGQLSNKASPLLGTIGGRPRGEWDKSFREHVGGFAQSKRESTHCSSTPKAPHWTKSHPSAKDSELKLDPMSDSDDSDVGNVSKGNIQRSTLTKKTDNAKIRKQSPMEKEANNASRTKRRRTSTEEEADSSQGSSRVRSSAGSHGAEKDDGKRIFAPKKATKTYGSQGADSKPSPAFMRSSGDVNKYTPKSKSGADASASADAKKSKASEFKEFIDEDDDFPSSSFSKRSTRGFQIIEKDDAEQSPQKKDKGYVVHAYTDTNGRDHETLDFTPSPPKRKRGKKSQKPRVETPPPAASFVAFDDDDDDFDLAVENAKPLNFEDIPSTQAISGFIDPGDLFSAEEDEEEPTPIPKETLCPWCSKPVSPEALRTFSKGERMGARQQQRFCRSHNKKTAQETYASKSYPQISWDDLPSRIETHLSSLLPIINDTEPSYYREQLARTIAQGKDRAAKAEENLNPGYYGPRGFNMMCQILVDRWGKLLKEKAVKDRVISGRGSAYFIQKVLVAELACRLVSEDLGVGLEEAKGVVEESRELGEMVNEDEG